MDPRERFCHNRRCWAYGRAGEGNIVIHSKKSGATAAKDAPRLSAKPKAPRFTGRTSRTSWWSPS
jgi:hypothetical protein